VNSSSDEIKEARKGGRGCLVKREEKEENRESG
jgi:hypothetical protein